ncbi:response regulator [Vicingaceae bacterium]|nr:response regulator [Vicingaceae bacterium]
MSSEKLRLAICDPNEKTREVLKKYLLGMDNVWLEADCSRYDFFSDVVEQTTPDVMIVDVDSDTDKALGLVESLKQSYPASGIVVVSTSTDGQLILKTMRAGAREFLNSPIQIEELVAALDRASDNGNQKRKSKSGSIIAIAGASGGVGTTSIAVNMACALAQDPENSVALVDLDLSLGDADVLMDTIPEYTLLDVAENISRLDLSLLRKSLTKHESGVYLLPRPVQLQDIETITSANFSRVLSLLKASFSHLVIDLSKSYNSLDVEAMKAAEHVVLLTQLDLPCLRNVVRLLMSLETIEGIGDKIKIVVNRGGIDRGQISQKKAESTIDREIFWHIPNNYGVVSECRNNGEPFIVSAPKSNISERVVELTAKLFPMEDEAGDGDKKDKKGWLGFLSSGKN